MINHVRTLLLNRPAQYYDGTGDRYAEYIDPGYRQVTLDPTLTKIHDIMIPEGIHPSAELYIIQALTRLLHAPELRPFTTLLDARITYDKHALTLAELVDPQIVVNWSPGASDMVPHYSVDMTDYSMSLAAAGQNTWTISYVDAYNLTVTPSRGELYQAKCVGLGAPQVTDKVDLVTDYLSFYLDIPTGVLTPGFNLQYEAYLVPFYDIAIRLNQLAATQAREGTIGALFKDWEPYSTELGTLYQVYTQTREATLRLGALLAALVIQTERQRRIEGGDYAT